ncbi:CHC2 zinc finger domain-containing protein [Azospirillum picis]|uniref:Zinc finger CHC2-type domain-containing protein n=1 Tax=Azospirillum picis TaxID=488438 RepID=A0ABU0MVQ0_9PROT|nr:CHC2 zinc finger domain-containing protein [Azospirillum picis]MBP2303309.1 hypothetical protein [Azospirillum picis]MDQ0537151.1 hypothetical protein [Azospirillum picis]
MSYSPAFLSELRARTSLAELVAKRLPLTRAGREYLACCPFHNEKTGSFTVVEEKGYWHCFGCGANGDAIAFLMRHDGLDFQVAVRQLAEDAGMMAGPGVERKPLRPMAARPTVEEQAEEKHKKIRRAVRHWRATSEAAGTAVETYLREARGIALDRIGGIPPTIRASRELAYQYSTPGGTDGKPRPTRVLGTWPAMVAAMCLPSKRIVGVHVTWLAPDGSGKARIPNPEAPGEFLPAKKMFGLSAGASIWLAPVSGPALGWAEGIETGLSVRVACPELPVHACGSLGNISGRGDPTRRGAPHPDLPGRYLPTPYPDLGDAGLLPPEGVRRIVLLEDADGKDPAATEVRYERAARRLVARDYEALRATPPTGMDFNDLLMHGEAA